MSGDAIPSTGVRMYLSKGDASPVVVTPTAISKASPAVVTADAAAVQQGQIVFARATGFPELDNRFFTVDNPDADTFELKGSDTTNSTGALVASPVLELYEASDLISLCLSTFAFALETPGTIAVGTYCNPAATLPAAATGVGTATLSGWIDVNDPGYKELLLAESDAQRRVFSILLPQGQGEIIAPMIINGITWDIPLDGGMAFTATATLTGKPRHVF